MPNDIIPEPVRGLPEAPPEGERILWQGAPSLRRAAMQVFKVHWIVGWFVLLAVWRAGAVMAEGGPASEAMVAAFWSLLAAALAGAILLLMAWSVAHTAIYTITNRRVGMRIGVALTLTLNLPHQWIESADLVRWRGGGGDIALKMKGETRLSYLVLWPHARPWKLNPAIPMLRGLDDADAAARILGEAAVARIAELGDPGHTVTGHTPDIETDDLPRGDFAPMPAE